MLKIVTLAFAAVFCEQCIIVSLKMSFKEINNIIRYYIYYSLIWKQNCGYSLFKIHIYDDSWKKNCAFGYEDFVIVW